MFVLTALAGGRFPLEEEASGVVSLTQWLPSPTLRRAAEKADRFPRHVTDRGRRVTVVVYSAYSLRRGKNARCVLKKPRRGGRVIL